MGQTARRSLRDEPLSTWTATATCTASRTAGSPPLTSPVHARGYTTLAHFVIGFAIQPHLDETGEPEQARRLSDPYRTLDPQTYPATRTVSELLPGATIDDEFEFGLNLIIDGLDTALRLTADQQPA